MMRRRPQSISCIRMLITYIEWLCLSIYLPVVLDGLQKEKEINKINLAKDKEDSKKGVILEYPKELHDSHNDYPLAPEKLPIAKPVTTLMDKNNYVLHYRNL